MFLRSILGNRSSPTNFYKNQALLRTATSINNRALSSSSNDRHQSDQSQDNSSKLQSKKLTHLITNRTMTTESGKMKITFDHQDRLPSLPVPDIDSTASKYLKSILPLVSDQSPTSGSASDQNPTPAYLRTRSAVEDFVSSPLVKELQKRLVERSKEKVSKEGSNWLIDWWNDLAYMGYRDQLVPFSSYYIAHQIDKTRRDGPRRAAGLIRALLHFRDLLESEKLEPDGNKNGPLCMYSYNWLFNSTRIPSKPSDHAKKFEAKLNNHIVVIRKNKFFEFSVIKDDGSWLSEAELENQFRKVVELAGTDEDRFPVGALTTEHRDVWTDARVALCEADPINVKSLERIESSIICVALDDTRPITRDELGYTLWAGDGKNRFFDKQQIIVCENGQSGFMAEHSCMDGTPVSRFNDWILHKLSTGQIDLGNNESSKGLPDVKKLDFNLNERVKRYITDSIKSHREVMKDQTLDVLQYSRFGKRIIKNVFRASPDAIAQLTFQLGYYKCFGRVPVTYESCQTRKFKFGRTEVIRSCSIESLEWCKAMEDLGCGWEDRFKKFREAEKAHLSYAKMASDGQGVDRHLLGLRLSLRPGEELPKLFQDPIYKESTHWILSTSTLPSEHFNGLGYGAVVPDGFGLAYAVNEESMRFTIVTITGEGKRLKHYLQEASDEIYEMFLKHNESLKGSSDGGGSKRGAFGSAKL